MVKGVYLSGNGGRHGKRDLFDKSSQGQALFFSGKHMFFATNLDLPNENECLCEQGLIFLSKTCVFHGKGGLSRW